MRNPQSALAVSIFKLTFIYTLSNIILSLQNHVSRKMQVLNVGFNVFRQLFKIVVVGDSGVGKSSLLLR